MVYLRAMDQLGLLERADAEYADADGEAAAVWTADRVARGERPVDALAEHAALGPDRMAVLLGASALNSGRPSVALTLLEGSDHPEARGLRVLALLSTGRTREGVEEARGLAGNHPDQPHLLADLWSAGEGRRVRRVRRQVVRQVGQVVEQADDPVWLYRARRLLVRAGEGEAARRAADRLVEAGEERPLHRVPWNDAMREAVARSLVTTRQTTRIPPGLTDAELLDVARHTSGLLRARGEEAERAALWGVVRERVDGPVEATAHAEALLATGRVEEALSVADDAVRLALGPVRGDEGRQDLRRWLAELDGALTVRRAVADALGQQTPEPDDLLVATLRTLFDPDPDAASFAERGRLQWEAGHREAAFTSLAVAQTLGAPVTAELVTLWAAIPHRPGSTFEGPAMAAAVRWAGERAALLLGPDPERASPERPAIGRPMPAWRVTEGGVEAGSEALRGQVVVLAVWASWCAPCMRELPELAAVARRFADQPVRVVAVSVDDDHRAYLRTRARLDLEGLIVLWDPTLDTHLGIGSLPRSFVIDREGVVRHIHAGYDAGQGELVAEEVTQLLQTN